MNVILIVALVVALGYIAYLKIASPMVISAGTSAASKRSTQGAIEQPDDELVRLAYSRLTDEEFAALKVGESNLLIAKIEEIKAEQIPDYQFLKLRYDAALKGAVAARNDHLRYLRQGISILADSSLEESRKIQKQANEILRQLNSF